LSRHLLVIGAQRCGTTYLASLLDAHPQVAMARPSRPEPKVFLSDDVLELGADGYRRTWFAHASTERLLGEKSTSYIEVPEAAERARTVLGPGTSIVALLRDPVARAVSNWRFSTDNGLERRSLEQALRDNLASATPWDAATTSVSPFAYLDRGRYADHLAAWYAAFPSTTHVLLLQEVLDDRETVARLFERLGLDPDVAPPQRERPLNESQQPVDGLPGELVEQLQHYFADSNRALSRRLGRRLPWWPDPYQE
jgi:hypothetical protein